MSFFFALLAVRDPLHNIVGPGILTVSIIINSNSNGNNSNNSNNNKRFARTALLLRGLHSEN